MLRGAAQGFKRRECAGLFLAELWGIVFHNSDQKQNERDAWLTFPEETQ